MIKNKIEYRFFLLYKLGSKQEKWCAEYYASIMISFFISITLCAINFWVVNIYKLLGKDFYLAKPYQYVTCLILCFGICFFAFIHKNRYVEIEEKYDKEWLSLSIKQRRFELFRYFWPTIAIFIIFILGASVSRYLNGFGFW